MSLAKLQLERYRLSQLAIDFNNDWLALGENAPDTEEYKVGFDFDAYDGPDGTRMIRLSFTCEPPEDAETIQRFNHISATVWGIFALADELAEDVKNDMLVMNGTAILHGIMRGTLISVTGACANGPYILPTINYAEMFEQKTKQLEAEQADNEKAHGDGNDRQV